MHFLSDTVAPAHPAILASLAEANSGATSVYGADAATARARDALCETFKTDLDVWLVASGTAANALALSILCPPTGAVLCHEEAHIERDERGAVEFFSGGGRLQLLSGLHGRIDPNALAARLSRNRPDFVHETPAAALSLSNLTEYGAAYRPDDLRALTDPARAAGLRVHLDGARFANALAGQQASPADLSWRAGVDVMSFGATKNGALGCEAILLFGETRGRYGDLLARAKRSGHMPPKTRFLAAQMTAYLKDGLWLDLARRANASAARLAAMFTDAGLALLHPVDGNELFVALPSDAARRLRAEGVAFHEPGDGSARFVCAWSTGEAELNAAARALSGV